MAAQLKTAQAQKTGAFGFKGNLLTLTVMHLYQADLDAIRQQLQTTVAKTPKFFVNMPIVLDLQHLAEHPYPIDYMSILNLLRQNGLIPVGISNGTPEQLQAANLAGLGTLSQIKKEAPSSAQAESTSATTTEQDSARSSSKAPPQAHLPHTKIILNPIRSGQQVYAKGGDLIIIATVSAGAEVLADGNIHVYGTLRGRALAGVQGDKNARIFCHGLQAELISIAGQYKLQDNIDVPSPSAPVQIFIQDDQLQIALL
jgi:septum site-determining protein MinC